MLKLFIFSGEFTLYVNNLPAELNKVYMYLINLSFLSYY